MRVALVLRSGGEYKPEHAQSLAAQVRAQGLDVVVLSDVDVPGVERIPLKHPELHGWWSKLELLRSDVEGDLMYLDLDSVVVGDLSDITSVRKLTLVRDFYRPSRLSSGMMFLPAAARHAALFPVGAAVPRQFRGDGQFFAALWPQAQAWQDVLPGQVVSYKCGVMHDPRKPRVHTGNGTVPANARIVLFHGNPRPWSVPPLKVA